jgi:hypothetical protein
MRYVIFSAGIITLIFLSAVYAGLDFDYAKGTDPQVVVEKTTKIMAKIHKDILAIKDRYREIENYNEDNFAEGYIPTDKLPCTGYCPPWEAANIHYGRLPISRKEKDVYLDIYFSDFTCEGDICDPPPIFEKYVGEAKLYLIAVLVAKDPELKEALISILERHIR